jgi:hypothetical protein
LLLALALSRPEVVRDADRTAADLGLPLGGRVVIEPEAGASRESIESAAHARGMVRATVDALMRVRADWGIRGSIHLFLATPFALATLLGHSLNAFAPLALYEPGPDHGECLRVLTLS